MYILSHFLGNNEECASYKVDGIMRSVHPVNSSAECIVNVEFTVPCQGCVIPGSSQPLSWE